MLVGAACILCMPLEKWWLSKSINGAWEVMLYRQRNGIRWYVAISNQGGGGGAGGASDERVVFLLERERQAGDGRPGGRRSLEQVYDAAELKRNGKSLGLTRTCCGIRLLSKSSMPVRCSKMYSSGWRTTASRSPSGII